MRTRSANPAELVPQRTTAVAVGALRLIIGAVMVVDPARLGRMLGVDSVTARRTGWLTQMIGGREIALGVGTLLAVRARVGEGPWLLASAVADAADGTALAVAVRSGRVNRLVAGGIIAAAVGGGAVEVLASRSRR